MPSVALGLGACALSSLFFGSMFVVVKRYKSGDGLFVQWVMAAAILLVGMTVNVFQGFPPFHPLAMLGGAFWAIGNATAIPIMSQLGIGLGMLIWGITNCDRDEEADAETPLIQQTVNPYRVQKRMIAIGTALCAGVLYGVNFVPVIYMQDHPELYPDASKNGLDFVFSHFCGIFAAASVIFVLYVAYSQNQPYINASIAGPSLIAGTMWGIAQTSW
ncbi:unnamed protein product, partial [Mesorhabditis spiculigera]